MERLRPALGAARRAKAPSKAVAGPTSSERLGAMLQARFHSGISGGLASRGQAERPCRLPLEHAPPSGEELSQSDWPWFSVKSNRQTGY